MHARAEAQFGAIARPQLLECGLSATTISRWLASNRLLPIHPGVYALGHRRLRTEGELLAALLYAGPGAALSHATAAWWWQLVEHRPQRLDVSTPRRRRSLPALQVHRPRRLASVSHRGLPVTTVAQTLLDFAAAAADLRLRRALAEADYRKLLDWQAIEDVLVRGHAGSAGLRRALRRHRPELARTRSVLEQRFLALCESHGIPSPQVNATIAGLTVDALWPDQRVIVELDGDANHSTPAQLHRDRQRELTLRALGYIVIRYTYAQVVHEPQRIAADLSAALLGRS